MVLKKKNAYLLQVFKAELRVLNEVISPMWQLSQVFEESFRMMMMMVMMTMIVTMRMIMIACNPMPCKCIYIYIDTPKKRKVSHISPALNGIPLGLQRQALAKTGEISVANCSDSDQWLNLSGARSERTSQDGDAKRGTKGHNKSHLLINIESMMQKRANFTTQCASFY